MSEIEKMVSALKIEYPKYRMSISRTLFFLLALSVFFLPLNGLPYIKALGELSVEGASYPILVAIIVYGFVIIQKGKIKNPKHLSYKILILFLVWTLISGTLNFQGILTNFTKGRSGLEKFSLQLILLLFMFCASMVSYIALKSFHKKNMLYAFRRIMLFSFLFTGAYSLVIEIPADLGQGWAISVLSIIVRLIHGTENLYLHRLRSLSGESSWFGIYLVFVFPWLMSYYFTEEKASKYFYVALISYALVLTFLTYSRTAYFIVALQFFAFILIIFSAGDRHHRKQIRKIMLMVVLLLGVLVADNGDKFVQTISSLSQQDTKYDISNTARMGAQVTAINMGLNYPLAGVGLGQYGFYFPAYIPEWASTSPELISLASSSPDVPWPSVHGLWARLLAETGFVGLILWFLMWATTLIPIWKSYYQMRRIDQQDSTLVLSLIICILGLMLIGFVSDSLRLLSYWITLGVAWAWLSKHTDKVEQQGSS